MTSKLPLVSIIIRAKNEERWIAACLKKILQQSVAEIEVVLVDSGSTDKTIQRAKTVFPEIKIVEIKEFLPGFAINEGVRNSTGEYLVCISSHCIPERNDWLEILLSNFDSNEMLAGVYGRQIPMEFTVPNDVRDLIITFGKDKRTQHKDPFFHNANSIIPRGVWEKFPFDESVTNIEDRLWAKKVLAAGFHLIYEPEASVYHHHGIHHDGDFERAQKIVQIMEPDIGYTDQKENYPFRSEHMTITGLLAISEDTGFSQEAMQIMVTKTVTDLMDSRYIGRVIVSTDSKVIGEICLELGAEVPFVRPKELAQSKVRAISVVQHTLDWMENENFFSDYVVLAEITHCFRPEGLIDRCIAKATEMGLDTVVASAPEYRPVWWRDQNDYRRLDDPVRRRDDREPVYIGLPAVCCVTRPSLIREGKRVGTRLGIIELEDVLASLEIRNQNSFLKLKDLIGLRVAKTDLLDC